DARNSFVPAGDVAVGIGGRGESCGGGTMCLLDGGGAGCRADRGCLARDARRPRGLRNPRGWLGRRTGRENRRSGAGGLTFEQSAELLLPVIARECLIGFQQGSWVSLRALARWYIGVAFGVGEFLPAILEPLLKGLRGRGDQQEDQRG